MLNQKLSRALNPTDSNRTTSNREISLKIPSHSTYQRLFGASDLQCRLMVASRNEICFSLSKNAARFLRESAPGSFGSRGKGPESPQHIINRSKPQNGGKFQPIDRISSFFSKPTGFRHGLVRHFAFGGWVL